MAGTITIKNPGLLTTIQDIGRWGYQSIGMSVAGAMDQYALRCANLLVGNDQGEAVLEATMMGPEIEFNTDEVIAITGGDMSPTLNGDKVEMWQSIKVKPGDVLKLAVVTKGMRTYIAFSKTIDVPVLMRSKSTFLKAAVGGYKGRKLEANDEILLGDKSILKEGYALDEKYIPEYKEEETIRVVYGPQDDYFSEKGKETFLSSTYTISNEADRMGYRLEGEKIEHTDQGADIISDGINFGSIQVPNSGQPIIMMSDRQTTGGYTKIGTVITPDLPKLAQMGPGKKLKFKAIDVMESQKIYVDYENKFKDIESSLKDSIISLDKAYDFNIVFGNKTYDIKVTEF